MSRKDFVLIAETIKGLSFLSENDRAWVASDFADKLATTNDRFKRATFLEATGTRKMGMDYAKEVHDAVLRNGNLD